MSVRRAQQEISSYEFVEWIAFSRLSPFGEARADLRTAIVAQTVANVNRKKSSRAFKPSDFMPSFGPSPGGRKKKRQSADEQYAILKLLVHRHNAKYERDPPPMARG